MTTLAASQEVEFAPEVPSSGATLSAGAIVGIVIGVAVVVGLAAGVAYRYHTIKRRGKAHKVVSPTDVDKHTAVTSGNTTETV